MSHMETARSVQSILFVYSTITDNHCTLFWKESESFWVNVVFLTVSFLGEEYQFI